jgi:hypothetical protein
MPELQGYPLHPFRLQEGHVGIAVMAGTGQHCEGGPLGLIAMLLP